MKKRQPTNHDSLTAIKSKNKNNKKPEKSIPNNRYEGLFAREERKMQEVEVNEELNLTTEEVNVETYQSLDCGKGNMACAVPTIHKGFDDEGND